MRACSLSTLFDTDGIPKIYFVKFSKDFQMTKMMQTKHAKIYRSTMRKMFKKMKHVQLYTHMFHIHIFRVFMTNLFTSTYLGNIVCG